MRPAQLADLFDPLDRDVLERVGRVERKGDQDDVRFRVAERSEALRVESRRQRAASLTPAVGAGVSDERTLSGPRTHLVLFLASVSGCQRVSVNGRENACGAKDRPCRRRGERDLRRVPQRELDGLAVEADLGDVVLKDGRFVVLRELAHGEHAQEGRLAARAVADDDEFAAERAALAGRRRHPESQAGARGRFRASLWGVCCDLRAYERTRGPPRWKSRRTDGTVRKSGAVVDPN